MAYEAFVSGHSGPQKVARPFQVGLLGAADSRFRSAGPAPLSITVVSVQRTGTVLYRSRTAHGIYCAIQLLEL